MKVPPLHRDGNKCALDGQSCVGGGHPRATLSSKMRRGGACVPARTSAQRRFHTGNRFVYHALCAGGRMMDAPLWSDTGGHTGIAPTHLHHIFPHIPVLSKKVCKLGIILIFALSNKKQQEYGTYTRTNFGNYFELHK